jgi:AraC-like DNA-binding protein/mannose-6-phosphate isomerase-like protein (cupin superfamily)
MVEPYFEVEHPSEGIINYPFKCHIQKCRPNSMAVEVHWHYSIEMLYSLAGKARVFVGGITQDFSRGDLVLINSREVHSVYIYEREEVEYIVLQFNPEVLHTTSRTVFESKYVLPFILCKSQNQKVFTKKEIQHTLIPKATLEITEEIKNKKYGYELAIKTHICGIFLWILRYWDSQGLTMDTGTILKENDLKMLQKVFDYLDENYKFDITAEYIAQLCNLSYSYFSRQFKALMGKTFTEYLNYIRITEAEKLLLSTDLNVTQVALETGFSSTSYFIQQFKHFKNISPKQFKKGIINQ